MRGGGVYVRNTTGIEHVVEQYVKRCLFILKLFAIFHSCHAHLKEDTELRMRPSTRRSKLPLAAQRSFAIVMFQAKGLPGATYHFLLLTRTAEECLCVDLNVKAKLDLPVTCLW